MILKRMIKGELVKAVSLVAMMAFSSNSLAQDKLASVAPVDVRMRAIDSVSIMHLIQKEELLENPAASL